MPNQGSRSKSATGYRQRIIRRREISSVELDPHDPQTQKKKEILDTLIKVKNNIKKEEKNGQFVICNLKGEFEPYFLKGLSKACSKYSQTRKLKRQSGVSQPASKQYLEHAVEIYLKTKKEQQEMEAKKKQERLKFLEKQRNEKTHSHHQHQNLFNFNQQFKEFERNFHQKIEKHLASDETRVQVKNYFKRYNPYLIISNEGMSEGLKTFSKHNNFQVDIFDMNQ